MASKKFFVDVDLSRNQLLKAVLEKGVNLASILTVAGQVGYNTTNNQIEYNDGTGIQYLLAGTTDFSGNTTNNAKAASVKAIYDYYKSNVGAGEIGITDTAGYFTATEVEGALQEIGSTLANINNAMQVVGTIDASATGGTWAYPANAVKGDAYVVTGATVDSFVKVGVAGLYTTAGSLVVCNNTSGQTDAEWFILDARREPSSTTVKGIIALATQAEVNAGSDDTKAVTALKLKAYIEQASGTTMYVQRAASLSTLSATATHGLGDDVVVQVWLNDTTVEEITSGVALTKTKGSATVTVNADPGYTIDIVCVGKATYVI